MVLIRNDRIGLPDLRPRESRRNRLCIAMGLSGSYSDPFLMLTYILTMPLTVFFPRKNYPPKAIGRDRDKGKR